MEPHHMHGPSSSRTMATPPESTDDGVWTTKHRQPSIRHKRLLNGAQIIKSYVHESELRRESSKFNNAPAPLYGSSKTADTHGDDPHRNHPNGVREERTEDDAQHSERGAGKQDCARLPAKPHTAPAGESCRLRRGVSHPPTSAPASNQHEEERTKDATHQPLAAFFAGKQVHRARRLSISAAQAPASNTNSNNGTVTNDSNPVKPVPLVKRKLQMESVTSHPYRTTTNAILTSPRGRNNLSSKLDAVIKSSLWMRRRVVMSDDKTAKAFMKPHSPRRGSATNGSGADSLGGGGSGSNGKDLSQYEIEKKVLAAFSQIVRMWRDRKRRNEATTLTLMNGNKLRKDNSIQSPHVVGILSRRMIREVPALTFFDVEPESSNVATSSTAAGTKAAGSRNSTKNVAVSAPTTAALGRNTPRGVCYTLDANGCRCIKMESGASRNSRAHYNDRHKKHEEITIEKAMSKTLHRKMAKRVKSKRLGIRRLADDFQKSRHELAMKLQAQLALRQAEGDKMFNKRLALLMADDTTLPPYQAQKELYLARVRCRKADLLEKCQTLHALGALLQHVEAKGEQSGLDVSSGEFHFLDLFRCVVEEDKVLTPLISDGIRHQLTQRDLQNPRVEELLGILRHEVNR